MKWQALAAAVIGTVGILAACSENPVPQVAIPRQDDPSAYRPEPQPKPLPQNGTIVGGVPQLGSQAAPPGNAAPANQPQTIEPMTPAPQPAAPQPVAPAPQQ